MNAVASTTLLARHRFMLEMQLKHPGFTYCDPGPFIKNKERIKKIKKTNDSRHIFQNKLDKAWFQHDMAYENSKDLNRRTAAEKVLHNKAFDIAKNPKYDGYQHILASMVHKWFAKKTSGVIKNEVLSRKELAEIKRII